MFSDKLRWIRITLCLAGLLVVPLTVSGVVYAADEQHQSDTDNHAKSGMNESGDHHGDGHDPGGPITWDRDLALWSLIVFCILVVVLKKFAWGPLSEALDQRESKIRQDIADADASRRKAEKLLAEHQQKVEAAQDEIQEMMAEARRDAETTRQQILDAANNDAEAARQRALSDIDRARDVALKDIFDSMSQNVADATEHVLGRALSEGDHERLIEEALSQLSESAG